jgi:MarR family transcriptional regulator, lower aerobic nicotinate degradation pathway regulator
MGLTGGSGGRIIRIRMNAAAAAEEEALPGAALPIYRGRMKATAVRRDSRQAEDYRLEDQAGHVLRRAHQRHTAIFQDSMDELQLTPTQFAALAKIGDVGDVSQNQLGRLTAMDPATIQGVIQRLEARGLIGRQPDPKDRRCTLLSLTVEGQALLADAVTRAKRITEATLAPLTPAERQTFLALLRKLI